jgi:phosphatidylglycerophosphate synthase
MSSYAKLYRQVRAEFSRSPKSKAAWDETNAALPRIFYRPAGLALAPLFILLGISGNGVTFLSFLLGTTGNVLFALGRPQLFLPGALFLIAFVILDFTDGVVARYEKKSTYFGKMVDLMAGTFVSSFLPLTVGFGVARAGLLPDWFGSALLYTALCGLAAILNLMRKFLATSFSLERARVRGEEPKKEEESAAGGGGIKYLIRRVLFHIASGSAQVALLILILVNLTWAFPLALLGLAGLQLLLTVLGIVRTGPTVLAIEKL